jgi:hypothetical protein
MNTRFRSARAGAVLAAVGALLLAGCGEQPVETRAVNRAAPLQPSAAPQPKAAPTAAPATVTATATATKTVTEQAPAPEAEPELEVTPTALPPGDPGLDAPRVPDPGRPEHDRDHEEPALTVVPAEAMLDVASVAGVLGGQWERSPAEPLDCASGTDWVAERTVAFASDGASVLQTVATHRSLAAADHAVQDLAASLRDCGWTNLRDPRLGSASAAASSADGSRTVVIIAAEGVTTTLAGSAGATDRRARWSSLLDLALGDSCAATAHGCH